MVETLAGAMVGYIVMSLVLALICLRLSPSSLRPIASGVVRSDWAVPPGLFDRPDLGVVIIVCGTVGVAATALAGWWLPVLLADVFDLEGALSQPITRAAQVVGALCFATMAMCMFRVMLFVVIVGLIIAGALAAIGYVLG